MEKLREKLGDALYREVAAKLGETRVILDDGRQIPKHRFDCVNVMLKESRRALTAAAAERDALAAEVKKLREALLRERVYLALSQRRAKNVKAAAALLRFDRIEMSDDGTLSGLTEQLAELVEQNPFLFESGAKRYMLVPVSDERRD